MHTYTHITYTHTHIHTHTHTRVHTHAHTHTHTHVYTHTHIYLNRPSASRSAFQEQIVPLTHTHTHSHTQVYIHTYIYISTDLLHHVQPSRNKWYRWCRREIAWSRRGICRRLSSVSHDTDIYMHTYIYKCYWYVDVRLLDLVAEFVKDFPLYYMVYIYINISIHTYIYIYVYMSTRDCLISSRNLWKAFLCIPW